ncbi:MAG TPA: ribonuclease H [Candidatus Binataceae bacterium]|nr:ribonuclease H [Candidatus Binataceae bacterium]
MSEEPGLVAYADGSCIGNPGPGGWGVVLTGVDGTRLEVSGAETSTTNNRMEITAAIEALRRLPSGSAVTIRSDSQYLVKTMTLGWKRRENLDLWTALDAEAAKRRVRWEWVRGHSGDALNERADELARSAALGKSPAVSASATTRTTAFSPNATKSNAAADQQDALAGANNEAVTINEIRPLLGEHETLRRCASCGRAFVDAVQAPKMLAYCSLAECQLRRRRGGA